jgi:hypothetical protein
MEKTTVGRKLQNTNTTIENTVDVEDTPLFNIKSVQLNTAAKTQTVTNYGLRSSSLPMGTLKDAKDD